MDTHKLYKDTITLLFDSDKHFYSINNNKIPGTTSILQVINKPALIPWAVGEACKYLQTILIPGKSYDELEIKDMLDQAKWAHRRKKDTAADIGVFVHQWCEDYITGKNPPMPINENIRNGVQAFLDWQKANQVAFHLAEQVVYSKEYNYAGTFDFTATLNGELMLGDFKTSSGIYDEMFFQTAAYQIARQEEYPKEKYKANVILRLGKDGEFESKVSYDFEKNKTAFLGAHALYTRLEEMKQEYFRNKNKE